MWLYIVIFILVALFIIYTYINKTNKKKDFVENNEYIETGLQNNAVLYTFYTTWCPHSKKTLETLKTIKPNYTNIEFKEVNAEKDLDLANSFKVDSYPTIILLYKDEKYMYDADLEESTFRQFIRTTMK
jgi:thiol-disulfide isomerase/thioredoxin